MILFFPYNTDAPIYYRPYATIGLIVFNIACFIASCFMNEEILLRWILSFDTINPIQWVSASFLHADVFHLLGNMLFLWAFGLVVEGKLGWKKFLPLYLLTAFIEGGIGQIFVFFFIETSAPGALGASGVIYSLITMTLLWAPNNHIQFAFGFFWRFGLHSFNAIPFAIHSVFFFYLAFDVIEIITSGLSSGFLHFIGVIAGLAVGIPMLLLGYVDCEGADILSAVSGKKFVKPVTAGDLAEQKRIEEERRRQKEEAIDNATQFVENLMKNNRPEDAMKRYDLLLREHHDLKPDNNLLLRIGKSLIAHQKYEKVVFLSNCYFDKLNSLEKNYMALFSATAHIKLKQPKSALKMLQKMSPNLADEKTKKAAQQIKQAASKLFAEGVLEIESL